MEDTTLTQKSGQSREVKKIPKPNNLFNVECDSIREFYKWWFIFLRPFVNLTDREIEVIASLLKYRLELSKSVSDVIILDKMTLGNDAREKALEECNMTLKHFYVIINSLKKKGVIEKNIIRPEIIPNVRTGDNGVFYLMILFKKSFEKA